MKKVIPIILVLTMAFAFSMTALAEDDIEVLPPVDPGLNEDTGEFENLDLELDKPPVDVEGEIWGATPEWYEDNKEFSDELDLWHAEQYKNSDAYDADIFFDAIQYIAEAYVFNPTVGDYGEAVSGVGGWITVTNYNLGNDTIKAILQWFEGLESEGYILITDFEYDAETGTLRFYVDDIKPISST